MTERTFTIFVLSLSVCVLLSVPLTAVAQGLVPKPALVFPEPDSIISDGTLIIAEQDNSLLPAFDIRFVRFEYSTDGVTWTEIDTEALLLGDHFGELTDSWDVLWDTEELSPGQYLLRVTMETFEGQIESSAPIITHVNKAPVAHAAAKAGSHLGMVLFDGTRSHDPDGQISDWIWDFGDGGIAFGPVVEHIYANLTRPYDLTLTVRDDLGTESTAYSILLLSPRGSFIKFKQDTNCRCTDIKLRKKGDKALGPDAKEGGKKWPAYTFGGVQWFDGETLGPLEGKANQIGYVVEIVATVEGDPAHCTETQVAKATTVFTGYDREACARIGGTFTPGPRECTVPTSWTGTKYDLNADDKMEFTSPGGLPVTLQFPQDPKHPNFRGFKPHSPKGTSRYDKPSVIKKHVPIAPKEHKIVWLVDGLHFHGQGGRLPGVNSSAKFDIVSMVRGSDEKYCYVKSSAHVANLEAGGITEQFASEEPVIGATEVPGLGP
jgi:hypothetical protein